jgi:hypothetical protein
MRFKLGLLVGGAVGYWAATRSTEEKRHDVERLVERVRSEPRLEQARDLIGQTVDEVTEASSGQAR